MTEQPGLAAQEAMQRADLAAITDEERALLETPLGQIIADRLTAAGWSPTGVLLWFTGPNSRLDEDRDERPVDYVRRLEAAVALAEAEGRGEVDTW